MRMALAESDEGKLQEPAGAGSATSVEEAALLRRIAAGDARAFRVIVGRHLPHLLSHARRMLREDGEAEDMAQEALLRLWRNAGTLELGPGGLKPWLRRVVSNLCIDRIRGRRHETVVDEVPEVAQRAEQLDGFEQRELVGRVEAAMRDLPDRQRQAVTLFHFEGLSQIEVGRMLGISDEAVESLLARGRRALKAGLKDDWRSLLPDPR